MVLGDPALIVALGSASGDTGRLGARQGLGDLDRLLALLGRSGGATGLGEERLDPRLVHKVEDAAEDTSQEEVEEDAVITVSSVLGR